MGDGNDREPVALATLWPKPRVGPGRQRAPPSISAQREAARAIVAALAERHHLKLDAAGPLADALLRYRRAWDEPKPRASTGPRKRATKAFTKARRQLGNLLDALSQRDSERTASWAAKLRRSLGDSGILVTLSLYGADWATLDRRLAQPSKLTRPKLEPLRGVLDALLADETDPGGGRDQDRLGRFLLELIGGYGRGGGVWPGWVQDREGDTYRGPLLEFACDALDAIGRTARDAIGSRSDETWIAALGRRLVRARAQHRAIEALRRSTR